MLGKVNRRQANMTLFKGKNGLFSKRKIVLYRLRIDYLTMILICPYAALLFPAE